MANGNPNGAGAGPANTATVAIVILVIIAILALFYFLGGRPHTGIGTDTRPDIRNESDMRTGARPSTTTTTDR